ncbi:MAG: anthranilate synthase component II [Planctomycetaceae bacterium]
MLLLIDNYDSFVHNLARYVEELGHETLVVRNDAVSVDDVRRLRPAAIIISPGPCTPTEAGISLELVRELGPETPMLGVCLGHQAIAQALGGRIIRAPEPVHGRTALVEHAGQGLFAGLPNPLRATRYHSLIVEEASLPPELRIVARTRKGVRNRFATPTRKGYQQPHERVPDTFSAPPDTDVPMALKHVAWPTFGVQFHPESILTECGHRLLANFLSLAGLAAAELPPGDLLTAPRQGQSADDEWWASRPL